MGEYERVLYDLVKDAKNNGWVALTLLCSGSHAVFTRYMDKRSQVAIWAPHKTCQFDHKRA